jgi:hypothetical protein
MNSKQVSKLAMNCVLRDFLKQNENIVNSLPQGSALLSSLVGNISTINSFKGQQVLNQSGIVADKNIQKRLIAEKAIDLKNRLLAFATLESKGNILQRINTSNSKLRRGTDNYLLNFCRIFLSIANDNASKMLKYGVKIEELAEMEKILNTYAEQITTPRLSLTERIHATKRIEELTAENDAIISKLDLLVELIKKNQADFYKKYHTTRKLVMLQGSPLKLKAKAFDSGTKERIKGVKFEFIQVQEGIASINNSSLKKPTLVKITAKKGTFHVKSIPSGNYMVAISKPGYEKQEINVSIADGDLNVIDIEMIKN